ncbi:amidase [Oxalobacteraceae bacterium CAVE-383]|nr:amidase [Oxalobacteraceae bacterium CAVE-383]
MTTAAQNANAFVKRLAIQGGGGGRLNGLTFAAKDNFDIAGEVTGYGNPDWARTHAPAASHAFAVQRLLDQGASLRGKTHTDELAYSLMGVNAHYGVPLNTADPTRVPGGSSSGSAAATAAGLVDIGLGSDTGGSIRMPASFCGLYGMRPTHGRISMEGLAPLAPSFDTVGWFARDLRTLSAAAAAFSLAEYGTAGAGAQAPVSLLLPTDAWALAEPCTAAPLQAGLKKLEAICGRATSMRLSPSTLAEWADIFRICQAAEIWATLGPWVLRNQPEFGPGIRERFDAAREIDKPQWDQASRARSGIASHLRDLLGSACVIVMPTVPAAAPKLDAGPGRLDEFRYRALALLCPAGLGGLPQVTIPIGTVDGGPIGISLLGGPGSDGLLLAVAQRFGTVA